MSANGTSHGAAPGAAAIVVYAQRERAPEASTLPGAWPQEPRIGEVYLSAEELATRVRELGVQIGADYEGHAWLLEPMSFFFVATVIVVWMSVPFVAFTGYAALTQVSEDLTEAAELDGAGAWQRLRHVVLPAIRPVLLVIGLLQIIWDLRVFTQIYVLQQAGGVTRDTNLLGTYIYRLGIGGGKFGMAAAVAIFMLVLTVILTGPYIRAMLRHEED